MRARICELHSYGLSYSKIHEIHRDIPKSTIASTCQKEKKRIDQVSCPRSGRTRAFTEDQRDAIFETVELTPEMTYEALRDQEAPNASIRSVKRLLQEMNIRKWIRLRRPALTPNHA
jgi:hypothetical protein